MSDAPMDLLVGGLSGPGTSGLISGRRDLPDSGQQPSDARKRYRNFRFSIPYQEWCDRRIELDSLMREIGIFAIGQQEISAKGHNHMEMFLNIKMGKTYSAVKGILGLAWVSGVDEVDVEWAIDYCRKEDTRVIGGATYGFGNVKKAKADDEFWVNFLACQSVTEGLQMVEREKPLDFIKMAGKLEQTIIRKIGAPTRAAYNNGWKMPFVEFTGLTVIFVGPTGIGKTNFALSHFKNPLHITIRQDFEKLGPNKYKYDGIVIDDLSLAKWDCEEVIKLTDNVYAASINVKYGTGVIKSGLKRIICSNKLDQVSCPTCPEFTYNVNLVCKFDLIK